VAGGGLIIEQAAIGDGDDAGGGVDAGLSDACMPALPGPLLAGVREALMQEIAG
jgi:hypothetical protein